MTDRDTGMSFYNLQHHLDGCYWSAINAVVNGSLEIKTEDAAICFQPLFCGHVGCIV